MNRDCSAVYGECKAKSVASLNGPASEARFREDYGIPHHEVPQLWSRYHSRRANPRRHPAHSMSCMPTLFRARRRDCHELARYTGGSDSADVATAATCARACSVFGLGVALRDRVGRISRLALLRKQWRAPGFTKREHVQKLPRSMRRTCS
jgi:hypothetical protein